MIRPTAPQAVAAVPLLHELCSEWATTACGELDGGGGGMGEVQQRRQMGGWLCDSLEAWVRRGWVKSPERAIRKALARRGGDVSLVVDLCRGRIVFETLSQVVRIAVVECITI